LAWPVSAAAAARGGLDEAVGAGPEDTFGHRPSVTPMMNATTVRAIFAARESGTLRY
jgi:hypothetical protein